LDITRYFHHLFSTLLSVIPHPLTNEDDDDVRTVIASFNNLFKYFTNYKNSVYTITIMDKLLNFGILMIFLTILTVVFMSVISNTQAQITSTNMSTINPGQTNNSNMTLINSSKNTQQPQEIQLQPLTIPDDVGVDSGDLSNSQFSPSNNNNEDSSDVDLMLLSQNYDNERFGDRLVGELLNNGSETAEFVQVSASFYDEEGAFLGTSSGVTQPSSIPPGARAGFEILITSDTIEDDTERYEFSIQWTDEDFDQHTIRLTGVQGQSSDNDNDNNDNNGNQDSRIAISSLTEPQTDPRNDPKYDSIDWQDDDPSKNLSIEEMDEILEEREEENDSGGDDSGGDDSGGDDSGGDDSGGDDSGGDDSGGDDSGGDDSGGDDSGGDDS
jgi:hypothetical protein